MMNLFTMVKSLMIFLVCCASPTWGSFITMESSGNFTPFLTPITTLKCALQDSLSGLNPAASAKRDVSSTTDNVHIAAIVITRNQDQDVASITAYSKAQGFVDQDKMSVSGDITEHQGQLRGYLEVIWTNPTQAQAAEYNCRITGFSETGHSVVFFKPLTLNANQPTLDTLVQYVVDVKEENVALKRKLDLFARNLNISNKQGQDLMHKVDQLTAELYTINTTKQHLTGKVDQLENNMDTVKSQVSNLTTQTLNSLGSSFETGNGLCRNSNTQNSNLMFDTVHFTQKYTKAPKIYISLTGMGVVFTYGGVTNPHYSVLPEHITISGFRVRCYLSERTYSHGDLFYTWITLPSQ